MIKTPAIWTVRLVRQKVIRQSSLSQSAFEDIVVVGSDDHGERYRPPGICRELAPGSEKLVGILRLQRSTVKELANLRVQVFAAVAICDVLGDRKAVLC